MVDRVARSPFSDSHLGEAFVRLALRAAEHHPILKAVYLGPIEWLDEARTSPGDVATLTSQALSLADRAQAAGDLYLAGESRAIATQLEVLQGRQMKYEEFVGELLGAQLERPADAEVEALRGEVAELAGVVTGNASEAAVGKWEMAGSVTGEEKWDAALDAYRVGRRYAFGEDFPVAINEELDLARLRDELWSVNLSWEAPRRMIFGVNVATSRTAATTAFEVAHNIYPGDYLHVASLAQHTYGRLGILPACIKLKNAPESVVSEGIEDTAYLRAFPDPTPSQLLAAKLEWLRRAATIEAALSIHVEGMGEAEALAVMISRGFIAPDRARFQLRLINHPLWGPYQYSYWLGRKLVEEGDRRAARAGRMRDYLEYLYTGLHTPSTFLTGLDRLLTVSSVGSPARP